MATLRDNPYGSFNFTVALGGAQGDGGEGAVVGGFAEVSGLTEEIVYAEYRNGNEKSNTPRKIPTLHKATDVTLKRGVIGSVDLFQWLRTVAEGTRDARTVVITLLDEARNPVVSWRLRQAQPRKWTGPTLCAMAGGHVAIEELVLVHEGIEMS